MGAVGIVRLRGHNDRMVMDKAHKKQSLIGEQRLFARSKRCDFEIISSADVRRVDTQAVSHGVSIETLMENAGCAVADAIITRFHVQPVSFFCGPGANGGDGWVAARALQRAGWPVKVFATEPSRLQGASRGAALKFLEQSDRAWEALPEAPPVKGLIVDALFGVGLSRPLSAPFAGLVAAMATTAERVIAIDLPSGLDAGTGQPVGEAHACAALSVTFVRKKPAHVLAPGRFFCGDVVVADIGAPQGALSGCERALWENGPWLWEEAFPWPGPEAHKHQRGALGVISGGFGRSGAARLAAQAGLTVGAGLVTVHSPADAMAENAAHLTAVMVCEAEDLASAANNSIALVVGPGFGLEEVHGRKLSRLLGAPERPSCVLDADAITLLSRESLSPALRTTDVLTPHFGEFRRLFPDIAQNARSKIEAARAAADRIGAVVLLKGPDTVIAAPDGCAAVNMTGTPFLATAGSGDVLAGVIGGLMAQGMASFEAAAAGAWLHGRAGEALGPGLTADRLHAVIPRLLNDLAPARLKKRTGLDREG